MKSVLGGAVQRHYAHLERMTIGEVRMETQSAPPTHSHPHGQITSVISGRYEFTIGARPP